MESESKIKKKVFNPIYCQCCKNQICKIIESKNSVSQKIIINPTPNIIK
jgi:hypothetical protein